MMSRHGTSRAGAGAVGQKGATTVAAVGTGSADANFRAIFEQAAVGIALRGLDGRWLKVNRKFCDILGYSEQELLGMTSMELTVADDLEVSLAYNRRISGGDVDSYTREKRYRRGNGAPVWVELSVTVVRGSDGEPSHIISVIVDIDARKAAERRVGEAEQRLRAGLENLGEMIVLTDAEDRIVIANRRFIEFNRQVAEFASPGCHYSEHLRAGISLGLFPDAAGREEAWIAERMAMRHERRGPVERRRQDGRWLLVDDQPLPDGGIVSYGIEITERKQAEAAVVQAHERLRLALGFSRVVLWDHDLSGGEMRLSEVWTELTGDARTRMSSAEWFGIVHPADLGHVRAGHDAALQGTEAEFHAEFRVRAAADAWRWMLSRGRVSERDGGGRPIRMIGTHVDVTERKQAETALAASEERFRSLVNLSNDVFWETDEQHRFIEQDYSGVAAVRPPSTSEIGMTRWEVPYVEPDEEAWRRHRADLDARRVFRDFELARPSPDGGVRYVQVSGEPVFDADGHFRGYRGVGKDVTARRRAENDLRALNADLERRVAERTAALETAYRELESFSYSVSHDLRAPLRAIAGFANLLVEDEGGRLSDGGRRYLTNIDRSARQMGDLTDALLAMARTSRHRLTHQALDMSALANAVAAEWAVDYPRAWLSIGPLKPAHGDPTLIRQVLRNLIGNALKYSAREESPRIEIGCETGAGRTVYFVRDNGVGFDMTYADRLFKPFERLHTEAEFRGTGIGLALVNLIVQRHGGRIWAEGAPGHGATFRFTLPEAAARS